MGKALKIVFYVLVIALLFLWAMTVAEKCKNKKLNADQTEEVTDDLLNEDFSDDIGDLTDLSDDDEVEDLTDDVDAQASDDNEEEVSFEDLSSQESAEDLSDLTEPIAEEKRSTPNPSSQKPAPRPVQSITDGQYLLVAGNYSVESNAQQMISKLKRMGYNNAEIVQFDNSNFSTVVASRFNDFDKATAAKGTLVGRGIDCYVHKQKF